MKYLALLPLLLLAGCSDKPYLDEIHCSRDKAYNIENAVGDLVYLHPIPGANTQCKELK